MGIRRIGLAISACAAVIGMLFSCGCASTTLRVEDGPDAPISEAAEPIDETPAASMWHRGIVDAKTGRLIAFWVLRKQGDEPVTIDRDYGMLIIWDDDVRRFFLFDNPRKCYFVTDDFSDFLDELRGLPTDITLDWPDTCCAPRFWGMPDGERDRLEWIMDVGRRQDTRQSQNPHIVCICESEGIKLLGAEPDSPFYGARPRKR